MPARTLPPDPIETFLARWDGTELAEHANYQSFLNELCAVLGVALPEPARRGGGDYRYERSVTHHTDEGSATTTRRIDLYRRDRFILEAKQGENADRQTSLFGQAEAQRRSNVRRSGSWGRQMVAAKGQAEGYVRDLPPEEASPPFLIVCDIGFCFDLYADFSGTGRHYAQFPDREGFRIYLPDLREPAKRDLLRRIWDEPQALNPAHQRVAVTRDIAALLARLAIELEGPKDRPRHAPQSVATFLMRCIFCMFAQSIGLLPTKDSFTELLEACRENPPSFVALVGDLWRKMNDGGFSAALRATVRKFNGGLFAPGPHGPTEPLPVDAGMLDLLIQAARRDWADVEPAIFGTLLENALDPRQRSELGAHFTPRSFVERLVLPTIMEPLRAEWDGAKAAAYEQGERGDRAAAAATVRAFHARLCSLRVLDPACGTGNFLYVTMELMKRLEGEVLDLLISLDPGEGDRFDLTGVSVDPHQFLGLEKNPRAVPVAELVLWIGWLQWHFRTRGNTPPAEPILRDFHNIREADALLAYSREEPERDRKGDPVTRWGGRTTLHPITGEHIPDLSDRVLILRPVAAKAAKWPDADFVVGNPPFVGTKRMRDTLGDGYVEALWKAHPKTPRSTDLVMFWWHHAAQLAALGRIRRFGLISPNSLDQFYNRSVIERALDARKSISIVFAVPDHPWSDVAGSAAVRIAMTVGEAGLHDGVLRRIVREESEKDDEPQIDFLDETGRISARLKISADPGAAHALLANARICFQGCKLGGSGFIISPSEAQSLGAGRIASVAARVRSILRGRDLTQRPRADMVIDLFGLTEEKARKDLPSLFQHVLLRVKPERDESRRQSYRDNWWIFQEPRPDMRAALFGLSRYIATSEVGKHRIFAFCDWPNRLPDGSVMVIASPDALFLGVLQSRFHLVWTLSASGTLEDRPRYHNQLAFSPFPFPVATEKQISSIRAIATELDAHRKVRLAAYGHLTMTLLYNVLEKLRSGAVLSETERDVHDAGQVSVLRHLHDQLDEAVAAAYGWPADLPTTEIVARVVALNAQRRAEEANGLVRWLRPEFQAPEETRRAVAQPALGIETPEAPDTISWPRDDAARQFIVLRTVLARSTAPAAPAELARRVKGAPRGAKIGEMLRVLVALGQAREAGSGRFTA